MPEKSRKWESHFYTREQWEGKPTAKKAADFLAVQTSELSETSEV
jgi:hypothetical protein